MRRLAAGSVPALLLALLVSTAGPLAAPRAALAAGTPPAVTSFSVPAQAVDLETSEGAYVSVHITDDAGVVQAQPDGTEGDYESFPYVLANDSGTTSGGYLLLGRLVSGTPTDGDWLFGPFATAKPYGTYDAYKVHVVSTDGDRLDFFPAPHGYSTTFRTIGRFGAFVQQQTPGAGTSSALRYGEGLTIRGRLQWFHQGGHALPGVTLTAYEQTAQTPEFPVGGERVLGTVTTGAGGAFSFTFRPQRNAFRIYLTGPQGTTVDNVRYHSIITWTGKVVVQVAVGVQSRPSQVRLGQTGYVEGNVLPDHAGQRVYLQRATSEGWRTVSSAVIRASGRYTLPLSPTVAGTLQYRVYKAGDSDHVGYTTPAFTVTAL